MHLQRCRNCIFSNSRTFPLVQVRKEPASAPKAGDLYWLGCWAGTVAGTAPFKLKLAGKERAGLMTLVR